MDNLFINLSTMKLITVYSHNRIPYRNEYSMKNYSPTQRTNKFYKSRAGEIAQQFI